MEETMADSEQSRSKSPTSYRDMVQTCYAIFTDNERALLEQLKNGFDVNYRIAPDNPFKVFSTNLDGMTALQYACDVGSPGSVKVLLDNGADFLLKNYSKSTALHLSIEYGCDTTSELMNCVLDPECAATQILSAHVKNNITVNPVNMNGLSHFHIACLMSHVEAVKLFLNSGVKLTETIQKKSSILPGYTALHIAARFGSFEVVQLLMERGADAFARNDDGLIPLQLIHSRLEQLSIHALNQEEVKERRNLVTKLLEDTGNIASILIQASLRPDSLTAELCIACAQKCPASVNEITNKGVDINARVSFGFTALRCAAMVDFDITRLLLERGAGIFLRSEDDKNLLDICVWKYGYGIVQLLPYVQQLKKYTLQGKQSWRIALALHKEADLKALLLDQDVAREINTPCIAPDSPVWPGATPLHLAIIFAPRDLRDDELPRKSEEVSQSYFPSTLKCTENIIQTLIFHGASMIEKDAKGQTAVHMAFYLKKFGVVRMLLNLECRPSEIKQLVSVENPSDGTGLSHFHIACMIGCEESIKFLSRNGASLNEPIKSNISVSPDFIEPEVLLRAGSTPLHIVAKLKKIDAIKALTLYYDVDISVKDEDGLTPLDILAASPDFPALELVLITYEMMVTYCYMASNSVIPNNKICQFESLCASLDPIVFSEEFEVKAYGFKSEMKEYFQNRSTETYEKIRHTLIRHSCLEKMKEFMFKRFDCETIAKCTNSLKIIFEEDSICKMEILGGLARYVRIAHDAPSQCKSLFVIDVKSQMTFLHMYSALNFGSLIEDFLVKRGVDINCCLTPDSPIFPGCTALHLAVACCGVVASKSYADGVVKILLKHGADPTIQDVNGETPLHLADRYYHTEIRDLLLLDPRIAQKNLISDFGRSHFHIACSSDLTEVVWKFLQNGANPNELNHACDNKVWIERIDKFPDYFGFSPLHVAKNLAVIRVLLIYGADPTIRDCKGRTALHSAALFGCSPDVIKTFVRVGGIDVNSRSVLHLTPLDYAIIRKIETSEDVALIQTLLELGASVNHVTLEGNSTFAHAVESQNVNVLSTLIRYGTDINEVNEHKRSTMHELFIREQTNLSSPDEYITIIEQLCQKGIDIDCRDSFDQTPLHIAVQKRLDNGIAALLACGADINAIDYKGRSPLSFLISDAVVDGKGHEKISGCETKQILPIFIKHMKRMRVLNVPISPQNVLLEKDIYGSEQSSDRKIQPPEDHTLESSGVQKIEDIILTRNATLHDVMHMNSHQMASLVEDNEFTAILSSKDYHQKFPEVGGVLKLKFRIGQRRQLTNSARKLLNSLLKIRLPLVCTEIIVSYLNDRDLRTLAGMVSE